MEYKIIFSHSTKISLQTEARKNVKQSRYRPGVAQRVPGS